MSQLRQPFRHDHLASTPHEGTSNTPLTPQPTLDALFRQIAQDMRADAVSLGIDTGNGYRIAQYRADEELPENFASIVLAPPANDRIHARPLPVGSPRRRHTPRSQIVLFRTPGRPVFNRSAQRYLSVLQPHLVHIIELSQELESARSRESCARTLLEYAECGCLIISPDGTVIQHNEQARLLLERAGGTLARTLTLPAPVLQKRYADTLAQLIRERTCTPLTLDLPTSPPLRIRLQATDTVYGLLAMTIEVLQPTLVALLQAFQGCYGLTAAESRLCQALASGMTLKECACRWNRSYETLRGQLKTLFSKTGCRRQAQLVALYRSHVVD